MYIIDLYIYIHILYIYIYISHYILKFLIHNNHKFCRKWWKFYSSYNNCYETPTLISLQTAAIENILIQKINSWEISFSHLYECSIQVLANFNFSSLQNLILAKYFNPSLHFFVFEKNLLKSLVLSPK